MSSDEKRKSSDSDSPKKKSSRTYNCKDGIRCIHKLEVHFKEFDHPHLNTLLMELGGSVDVPRDKARKYPVSAITLKQQLSIVKQMETNDKGSSPKVKRPHVSQEVKAAADELERVVKKVEEEKKSDVCVFGEKCFRRHPEHFKQYKHPHLSKILDVIGGEPVNEATLKKFKLAENCSFDTVVNQLLIVGRLEGRSCPPSTNPTPEVPRSECVQIVREIPGTSSMPGTLQLSQSVRDKNAASLEKRRIVEMDRVKNSVTSKMEAAHPYNLFLTTVTESRATHHEKLSLSFIELIDPKLGELESVLQLNFMVQLGWLLSQFHIVGLRQIPMTLLYGEIDVPIPERLSSFIVGRRIKPPSPFGSHHTKLMIFSYRDGSLRVVVSTANLVEADWDNRTQGLWVSPRCPPLPEGADTLSGESPTKFQSCLTRYLSAYKVSELVPWMRKISRVDMSAIRVFFVGSVPGSHSGQALKQWGWGGLAAVLSDNVVVPDKNKYPVVVQCSSIGSLGPNPDSYLTGDVLRTLCSGKKEGVVEKPDLHFIYPSFNNVAESYDGLLGGGCLPYSRKTHDKQQWLTSFMCQWRSDKRHRTKAPPHIKTYCRVSPDCKKLSYFVLTSANLSKAAWGSYNKSGNLSILSYEAGVVFLPQYFFAKDYFDLSGEDPEPQFPLPYDLPVVPYTFKDVPWFFENLS